VGEASDPCSSSGQRPLEKKRPAAQTKEEPASWRPQQTAPPAEGEASVCRTHHHGRSRQHPLGRERPATPEKDFIAKNGR